MIRWWPIFALLMPAMSACDDRPPVAGIERPTDGQVFSQGAQVCLEGTGSDTEDGLLGGGSLHWVSSLDGPLGSGDVVCRDDLSFGEHRITLRVTDAGGQEASDQVTISITTPSALVGVENSLLCQGEVTTLTVDLEGVRLTALTGETTLERLKLGSYFFDVRFDGGDCGRYSLTGTLLAEEVEVCYLFYNELDAAGGVVLSYRREEECGD